MNLTLISPHKALNKAYLKVKPSRNEIEHFKKNFIALLDGLDELESEEHCKNDLGDFLKNTFYHPEFYINTKDRTDLVIHIGSDSKNKAGVLIEAKKPGNISEMIRPGNLNVKAFHELILYYLRERITKKNLEIKYLIATNIYEWYLFDATLFEKIFAQNKALINHFIDFEEGRLTGKTTDYFYKEIVGPFISAIENEILVTYFNFRDYEKQVRNKDKKDDSKLIALFKILSPEHLLKLPFANDSNSLDKTFYSELLHIIGLTEVKSGSKKLIERKQESNREPGSLIENAIIQIESHDMITRLQKPSNFGETPIARLFNVSLELAITWINRILFLKLLEAQLVNYNKNNVHYAFLNLKKITGFDALDSLFFRVLARKPEERDPEVKELFKDVPYLNSSLFEPTDLERETIFVSNLQDNRRITIHPATVLRTATGKRLTGTMSGLEYLLGFLDAYDFTNEGSEDIQEENKTLINASVLGLIFEKLNGYKDGSFFTPGYITMYMCKETIRRAVLQKFKDIKGWKCEDLNSLYDKIEDKKEANTIINSLKICDPAVGSGHFLVSALNEIIAVKSFLKILLDNDGLTLRDYHIEVENDELIISFTEGNLFVYNPGNKESQRVQETLFREKQTIIENCLFGVDINPNSVKICRLRLWIELLKNAYYKSETNYTAIETLPNIDINIKCGNSLISRYPLDADIRQALRKSKWNIFSYRLAVSTYRNAENKEQKREMERLIEKIRNDFQTGIGRNDPLLQRLNKLRSFINDRYYSSLLFEPGELYGSNDHKEEDEEEKKRLEEERDRMEAAVEEIKNSKIFENAFEWRFEFPEVLNDDGDFTGFDVVIGNPPYIRAEELNEFKNYFKQNYTIYTAAGDIFSYFYQLSHSIINKNGILCFINNTFDKTTAGKALREFVLENFTIEQYIDFTSVTVFDEATTYPIILLATKGLKPNTSFDFFKVEKSIFQKKEKLFLRSKFIQIPQNSLNSDVWNFANDEKNAISNKVKSCRKLKDIYGKCFYGIKTALNEAFIIKKQLSNAEVLKPVYEGKDIKKWNTPLPFKWLILFKDKSTMKKFGPLNAEEAEKKMQNHYPEIFDHLLPFKEKALQRSDQGEYWWELRSCAYNDLFGKPKIIFPNLQNTNKFSFDDTGTFLNAPSVFLPGEDKCLLGILNSKIIWYYLKSICVVRSGGFIEVKPQYFEQIPIPEIPYATKQLITEKVDQIITNKKSNPSTDTSNLESEIDRQVYELYGLTEEEINIVESSTI